MVNILYYADSRGRQPVLDWVKEMETYEPEVAYRFYVLQLLLKEEGQSILKGRIKTKDIKKLKGTDGIWQLRVKEDRLLFFFYSNNFIVFTNQFRKKKNNTPREEIQRAEKRKAAYKN